MSGTLPSVCCRCCWGWSLSTHASPVGRVVRPLLLLHVPTVPSAATPPCRRSVPSLFPSRCRSDRTKPRRSIRPSRRLLHPSRERLARPRPRSATRCSAASESSLESRDDDGIGSGEARFGRGGGPKVGHLHAGARARANASRRKRRWVQQTVLPPAKKEGDGKRERGRTELPFRRTSFRDRSSCKTAILAILSALNLCNASSPWFMIAARAGATMIEVPGWRCAGTDAKEAGAR